MELAPVFCTPQSFPNVFTEATRPAGGTGPDQPRPALTGPDQPRPQPHQKPKTGPDQPRPAQTGPDQRPGDRLDVPLLFHLLAEALQPCALQPCALQPCSLLPCNVQPAACSLQQCTTCCLQPCSLPASSQKLISVINSVIYSINTTCCQQVCVLQLCG